MNSLKNIILKLLIKLFALCLIQSSLPNPSFAEFSKASHKRDSHQLNIERAASYAFPKENTENSPKTLSLLISKNNQILFERYANTHKANDRQLLWSVSKSFTSIIIGIAVDEGLLSLEDSICQYYPEIKAHSSKHCLIKIQDLLHWSSGLKWTESYEDAPNLAQSSVLQMLYGDGKSDMAGFTLWQPLQHIPNNVWEYSSGDSNILMGALRRSIGNDQIYNRYPFEKLFDKLEMKNTSWEQDESGNFVGSSYVYSSPKDAIKFGELILNNGQYKGEKIISKKWVQYIQKIAPAYLKTRENWKGKNVPGAHWWLNQKVPELNLDSNWPNAPADLISARGHWGQYILISPKEKLVIVRTGNDRGKTAKFNVDEFFKELKDQH